MPVSSPRASARAYAEVPLYFSEEVEHRRKLADAVNTLRNGKLNSTGGFTLAASVATTTLSDRRIGPDSYINFMPTTANAAAEVGGGTMYVSSRSIGGATVTHANNLQADRIFVYLIIG